MSKLIEENGLRIQIADDGMILKNEDNYSKRVYLGDGSVEWEEISENDIPVIEELLNPDVLN